VPARAFVPVAVLSIVKVRGISRNSEFTVVAELSVRYRTDSRLIEGYSSHAFCGSTLFMANEDLFEILVILRQITSTVDHACVGITRCNSDLRHTFVNRFYAEMVRKSPGEIEGALIAETVGAAGFEIIGPRLALALSGEVIEFQSKITYPGGMERLIHFKYVPDIDDKGVVIGVFSTEIDVTGLSFRGQPQ
jgi:PAS domain-containing protein